MHRRSLGLGLRVGAGIAALLVLAVASSCSKFSSGPAAQTGSQELDGLCHVFRPDALPYEHIIGAGSLPQVIAGSEFADLVGTDPDFARSLIEFDRVSAVPPGFEQDVAAFNAALDRILAGEPADQVAADYERAGADFGHHLKERCGAVWATKESAPK